jgi:hypothetical protein
MKREYYSDTIAQFISKVPNEIIGELVQGNSRDGTTLETSQSDAWLEQIHILQSALRPYIDHGSVYFEYSIPRLGKRIDVVALIGPVIFVLEFKVGEQEFSAHAVDQVWDYALDLKNFHESSHEQYIAPRAIASSLLDTCNFRRKGARDGL